jgi:cytochrome P450
MINLALIVALAFFVLYIVNWIYSYRKLSHVPGPFIAGWSRFWTARVLASGSGYEQWYKISKRYGSLARIGPNDLLTSDPELIRRMNAPRSPYRRAGFYRTFRFQPRKDNILSLTSEKKHEELRKKMSAGYSGKEVPHMESIIDEHVKEWVDLIRRKYVSTSSLTRPMDLAQQAQYFTLDVISDLAFNSPFGNLRDDADNFNYIKTMGEVVKFIIVMGEFPEVFTFLEWTRLLDLIAPSEADSSGLGPVIEVAKHKVAEKFDSQEARQKQDMLSSFLRHGLTQKEAESEVIVQM